MAETTQKIMDLIRKLFAKAQSAQEIGSAAEAAAFAAKANELLLRHRLEMTDLELQDEQDADPLGRDDELSRAWGGVQQKWSDELANAIATTHFCKLVRETRRGYPKGLTYLLGRDSDRKVARYLIEVLHREAKRLARAYLAQAPQDGASPAARRTSFLLGFRLEVTRRLREQRARVEQTGGQYAVVRLQDAEAAVEEYMRAQFPDAYVPRSRSTFIQKDAYAAGRAAGDAVGLGGGLQGGTAARAQQLLGGS